MRSVVDYSALVRQPRSNCIFAHIGGKTSKFHLASRYSQSYVPKVNACSALALPTDQYSSCPRHVHVFYCSEGGECHLRLLTRLGG